MVDNCIMQVTENLFEALQYLRSEDEDRILWIDATSINQSHEVEKGHQVRQMGKIYEDAELVLVWLGTVKNLRGYLMDFMKRIEKYSVAVNGDWRAAAQTKVLFEDDRKQTLLREDFLKLLNQPWFQRIWLSQEIANARVARVRILFLHMSFCPRIPSFVFSSHANANHIIEI